ncbi:excinuclease ABC subunit UvrA [bacterium]|jgi:excinuclease ABC subunit A|nr:excinuclease ABC subunit UvrA [bacterium]
MKDTIKVSGARVHNLKNVDLEIPRNKLVVFTGLSGSGKSSLAFDTIYAEGQRRYVESLSAYARQFLDKLDKPDVDSIEGLSPAISIDQKSASHNPRSTVGTITEIYDYLRLLYSSIGTPHCTDCGKPVQKQSAQEIYDQVLKLPKDTQITLYAPMISGKKGEFKNLFTDIQKDGFSRVRVNGDIKRLDEDIPLDKQKKHTIEVVVDRLSINKENEQRLFDSLETALRHANGLVLVGWIKIDSESESEKLYSEHFACADCGVNLPEVSPRLFSFNSPYGACPDCNGLGDTFDFDPDLVIDDETMPCVLATQKALNLEDTIYGRRFEYSAENSGFSATKAVDKLSAEERHLFLYGEKQQDVYFKKRGGMVRKIVPKYWEGVIGNLKRRYHQTNSEGMRSWFRSMMAAKTCESCNGYRLKPEAVGVTIGKKNIAELGGLPISEAVTFMETLKLTKKELEIANLVLKEVQDRLSFLDNVGLTYLSLDRKANTLSGGELQRIRLATQIGSGLTGVLYVLDEPSIGLHQRDNQRLLVTLRRLRDLGNTLIVVEHDEETIQEADYVVDIGPEAGRNGGNIVFAGTVPQLLKSKTVTAQYINGEKEIAIPKKRRSGSGNSLVVKGAQANNLQDVTLTLPLGKLVAITGVSGSGKSTLINEILHRALMKHFHKSKERPGKFKSMKGLEYIDKVITIDQSPIGRTPRSNPSTYTGMFTPIRELYAQTREARINGFKAGRFSFNVKGGRCEACQGDGLVKIEMHFLSDVYVTCDLCKGKRYNDQTLAVKFKGHSISDVLTMTVNQAAEVFVNIPAIFSKLQTLQEVGLGYIAVGQSATTLSGGEAQRIKLAKELSKRSTGKTLYLLDEPTTGLHFEDIQKLLGVVNRLVDAGNTVLVIEHNLDVIKTADHVIDLGPDGGSGGGQIVAEGTPETVAKAKGSYTGSFLKELLGKKRVKS